jgi:hypothetical protein
MGKPMPYDLPPGQGPLRYRSYRPREFVWSIPVDPRDLTHGDRTAIEAALVAEAREMVAVNRIAHLPPHTQWFTSFDGRGFEATIAVNGVVVCDDAERSAVQSFLDHAPCRMPVVNILVDD